MPSSSSSNHQRNRAIAAVVSPSFTQPAGSHRGAASNCTRVLRLMTDELVEIPLEATCQRDWAALSKELLEEILSHLYGEDVRSFHFVCTSWHAAVEYLFLKEHNPLVSPEPQSQWLLHKQCSELTYQFIHPVYPNVRYAKNLLEEAETVNVHDAVARHSKDGWLLMSSGRYSMLLFSPFPKKVVIELPDLPWPYELDGVAFSCAPTSPPTDTDCCVIFGIACFGPTIVNISTIRLGKKKWKCNRYENNISFRPSCSNPVFHKGMFYCLSLEGYLGVYNHKEDTWTVLEKPLSPRKWANEHYLVEHEGGLMSLFMGDSGSWVSIFKLNDSNMVWENVYSLEDSALFVSVPTCFARKSVLAMMKNKIFLPLIHDNYLVFYCLETKTFRTYGSNLCVNNLYRSEIAEQYDSCWIEPREICCEGAELDWLLETNDEETDEEVEDEVDGAGTEDDETSEDEDSESWEDEAKNGEEYEGQEETGDEEE